MSQDPNDIDLLVVYDREVVKPVDADRFRSEMLEALEGLDVPISVLLLTKEEHESSKFADMEGAVPIWPNSNAPARF
jgi:hypothetical protein